MTNKDIFNFLRKLKKNNNREWFAKNKPTFVEAKTAFEGVVEKLITEVSKFEPTLKTLTPKETVFRIYRDVRFSKDKTPYKAHFGVFLAPGGRKSIYSGYYIHVEDNNSFMGGGVWCPQPDTLKAIRTDIYNFTDDFKKIINNPTFKEYYGE